MGGVGGSADGVPAAASATPDAGGLAVAPLSRWAGARAVGAALLALALPAAGVAAYLSSAAHQRHDPAHSLQQLDLLYLDEPAPGAAALGLVRGRVSLLLFCARPCTPPEVAGADVVRVRDEALARAYALDGLTGYAVVDADLQVRYRSVDPDPAAHVRELVRLVRALDPGTPA